MYMTLELVSPWEKIVSLLANSTIRRARPAEARKACASNESTFGTCRVFVVFISLRLGNASRFQRARHRTACRDLLLARVCHYLQAREGWDQYHLRPTQYSI